VLLKEIRAIAGETLVLSPNDPTAEDANTSWLGAPPHERMGLSADEVVSAFEETAELLRDQITVHGHQGPVTFYVWHDEVAGQLRCSTRSCSQDGLAFDGGYRLTSDLRAIVVDFLEDRAAASIGWGEFQPITAPDEPAADPPEFPVWVCDLRP
jgi:hypothetical protein